MRLFVVSLLLVYIHYTEFTTYYKLYYNILYIVTYYI